MLSIVGTFVFGYIASQYAFPSIAVVMTFCMLCWSYNYCCKAFKITDEPLFSCFGGGGQDLGRTLSKERCFKNPFIHKHLGRSKRSCKVFLYWVTQHISQWLFCQTLVTHTLVFYFNHLAPITSLVYFFLFQRVIIGILLAVVVAIAELYFMARVEIWLLHNFISHVHKNQWCIKNFVNTFSHPLLVYFYLYIKYTSFCSYIFFLQT